MSKHCHIKKNPLKKMKNIQMNKKKKTKKTFFFYFNHRVIDSYNGLG